MCLSLKIADASTLATFIKCWAAIALSSREVASPLFMGAFFPQMDLPVTVLPVRNENISKITALKAKAARTSVRVESASALIWKCAMTASKSNLGFQEILCCLSAWKCAKGLCPPLPENYAGNCLGNINIASMEDGDDKLELQGLVSRIRKELEEFGELAMGDDIGFFKCTSI